MGWWRNLIMTCRRSVATRAEEALAVSQKEFPWVWVTLAMPSVHNM
jgi:hypothetical protein